MKYTITPQQKKQLSYKKDRRNTYGERGAHSRYAIRRNKDNVEREQRHVQNQVLRTLLTVGNEEEQLIAIENKVRTLRRRKFHKVPDTPLIEVISNKLVYRRYKNEPAFSTLRKKVGKLERGG